MRIHKRFIPLIIILAVVIAGAGMAGLKWLAGNGNHRITFSGNVELTEVTISFKIPGRLVELTMDEGDSVRQGMLVARLDQEQLESQHDRAKAALAAAKAQLAQLKTAIQYQRETALGQIELRTAELKQAESQLQELLSGSRSQEIAKARAAVDAARTEWVRAGNDWERAQALYRNEDISTARYEQIKTRFESAKASLTQAEEQLALLIEGPRKEDIESARAQVDRARASVRLAKAQRIETQRREQEADMADAEVDRARAELALIESQIKDTVALSPIEGIVLVKAAEKGEVLAAGTPVVTIGDLFHPWIRGYINEKDLDRVRLGQEVRITTDSGKTFQGTLSFIASEAEFTPKQIQTKEERVKLVYRVKVDVENPEGALKLNMPVDAEILPGEERGPHGSG